MSFGNRKSQTPVRPVRDRRELSGQESPAPVETVIEVDFFTRIQGFIIPTIVFVGMIYLVVTSPIYGVSDAASGFFGGSPAVAKCYSFAGKRRIDSKNQFFSRSNHSFWGKKGSLRNYETALSNVEEAARSCKLDYCPRREQKAFAETVYQFTKTRAWLYQTYFVEYGEPGIDYVRERFGGFRDARILASIRKRYKRYDIKTKRRGPIVKAIDMLLYLPVSQFGPCRTS